MKITTGSCVLNKDESNLVGISIGGGAPFCPCLYVVQVFDNTPAAKNCQLAAGIYKYFIFILKIILHDLTLI